MPGKTKTNSSQTNILPAEQQANIDLLLQGARDFYLSGGPKFYGGQMAAGPTAEQVQGRAQGAQYATGVGQNLVNNYTQGEQFWLDPKNIFNPGNIPGFNQAQDSVIQNTTRNLTESILPGIRSGSVQSGAYGGSRQGIAEGLGIGRTNDALAGQLANMQMDAYGKGLNMYNAAAGRAPQTFAMGMAPSQTLEQIGSLNQADEQRRIDEQVARYNFEQMAPLMNLEGLQAATGVFGQYGGTTKGEQTTKTGVGAQQILGGALMLGSMLAGPGGFMDMFGKAAKPAAEITGA